MKYKFNEPYELTTKQLYLFNPKHRNSSNPNASTWNITFEEEFDLADEGICSFKYAKTAFNVKKEFNRLKVLGFSPRKVQLILAKFVMSFTDNWHGYPADYVSNNQDKPKQSTLKQMVESNKISKKEMRCIGKGQKL